MIVDRIVSAAKVTVNRIVWSELGPGICGSNVLSIVTWLTNPGATWSIQVPYECEHMMKQIYTSKVFIELNRSRKYVLTLKGSIYGSERSIERSIQKYVRCTKPSGAVNPI